MNSRRQAPDELAPVERLLALMSMLRDREFGCPWDLQQTYQSLIPCTIEEVHEVAAAIEGGDRSELLDELGDLLFQIVFYAELSREEGGFDFHDVASQVTGKLLRRHPHVFPNGRLDSFGSEQRLSADEVVNNWEAIKRAERAGQRQAADDVQPSVLDGLPTSLPGLAAARKLQQRAASIGFDWPEAEPVVAKLREETDEFAAALAGGDKAAQHEELGDLLFAIVNLSRHCAIDPESALRASNRRFAKRFREMERLAAVRGSELRQHGAEQLEALWNQAKAGARGTEG